jgi:hypothetical protein
VWATTLQYLLILLYWQSTKKHSHLKDYSSLQLLWNFKFNTSNMITLNAL